MRRPTLADLRSATGLVIGLYVTMHLSNHALGLISVRAQEAVRPWVMALWHSPPGQVLLYGSLSIHAAVALIVLFRRRHFYMPAWEATQILLGLTIPYLLLVHIVNTRAAPASLAESAPQSGSEIRTGTIERRTAARHLFFNLCISVIANCLT